MPYFEEFFWETLTFSCNFCSCSSFMSRNILNSLGRVSTHLMMFWRSKEASDLVFSFRYLVRIARRLSLIFKMSLSPSWSKTARRSMKMRTVLSLKIGMQQGSSSLNISSFISSGSGMYCIMMLKGIPSTLASRAWSQNLIIIHLLILIKAK